MPPIVAVEASCDDVFLVVGSPITLSLQMLGRASKKTNRVSRHLMACAKAGRIALPNGLPTVEALPSLLFGGFASEGF